MSLLALDKYPCQDLDSEFGDSDIELDLESLCPYQSTAASPTQTPTHQHGFLLYSHTGVSKCFVRKGCLDSVIVWIVQVLGEQHSVQVRLTWQQPNPYDPPWLLNCCIHACKCRVLHGSLIATGCCRHVATINRHTGRLAVSGHLEDKHVEAVIWLFK